MPPFWYEPTASQESAAVQETLCSPADDPPAGTGTGRITHDEPFQTSENRPLVSSPTARQALAAGQATAFSRPPPAAGAGTGWIFHAEPFQRSASRAGAPVPFADSPIAVHAVVPEHATAPRSLFVAPAGAGGSACVQALPSQRSATGTKSPPEALLPTATHHCALRHFTPSRSSVAFPSGTVRTVQCDPFQVSANSPKPRKTHRSQVPCRKVVSR